MTPGTRALAFASRWFAPAIVHRTFEPLIADWQREWYDSAPARRPWVSVRGFVAFVSAALISTPAILVTPTPHLITRRVTARIFVFCLIVADLLSIPMVRSIDAPWLPTFLLQALPGSMMLAFPFSMIMAVDAIRNHDDVAPHVARSAALKLGAIAVLLMLIAGGWLLPLASQQWLRISTPAGWNVPAPRFQQQSTLALLTHPERTTAIVPGRQYTRAGAIRRELVQRAVMSIMPAMFIWLRWSTLSHVRRKRFWPLPASAMTALVVVAFFVSFFGGFRLEMGWELMPGTGLLLPLLVFGAWALIEQRVASRSWRASPVASVQT